MNLKNLLITSFLLCTLLGCIEHNNIYVYIVKNNTDKDIKVVFHTIGNNGISNIKPEWVTYVASKTEAVCFEHICLPEDLKKNGEVKKLEEWKFIKNLEVYQNDKKSNVDYLNNQLKFDNFKSVLGGNQGIYTIEIKNADFDEN